MSLVKDQPRNLFVVIPNARRTTLLRLHCEKPVFFQFTSYIFRIFIYICSCHYRTARPRDSNERCQYRLGVIIGRAFGSEIDAWFMIPFQPYHNSHPPYKTINSRKPIRLHSEAEIQIACDVMQSYGGSGVARSLYFYRTGEVCKLLVPLHMYCQDLLRYYALFTFVQHRTHIRLHHEGP